MRSGIRGCRGRIYRRKRRRPRCARYHRVGASSAPSAPFGEHTKIVGIHCDVACSIKFGQGPVVTVSNKRLAANQTECFAVTQLGH